MKKQTRASSRGLSVALGLIALLVMAFTGLRLADTTRGLTIDHFSAGAIPITVFQRADQSLGPMVLIAHGFAGSRPMMQQFAVTLAQNGYLAVTFDFSGHGRNLKPMTGDLTRLDGATQVLLNDMASVVRSVREHYTGVQQSYAVLGHSMSSDLVVRFAKSNDDVVSTIGVSLFSPEITESSPLNLLIINGALEGGFNAAGLDAVAQVSDGVEPEVETTYGNFANGTARRLVEADYMEHVGVLFSRESANEAVLWLNQVFSRNSKDPVAAPMRGAWILMLLVAIVMLWRSLVRFLPRLCIPGRGASLRAWPLASVMLIPPVLTPLILSLFDINFLPVLVGDYLAVHFLIYGLLTMALCVVISHSHRASTSSTVHSAPLWQFLGAVAAVIFLGGLFGAALNWQLASFIPTAERIPLMVATFIGTLSWFLADEWATRGENRWRYSYLISKVMFLLSLGLAVALNFEGLFFLLMIVPLMVPLLLVFGLLSRWVYTATGSPWVAAAANAWIFAWAIAVTFPIIGTN